MELPPQFIIHQTAHWTLNHHLSSALPGYLMLGSRTPVSSLAKLPGSALAELGGLLARTQGILEEQMKPKWLYISRFGHVPGYPIHFHFIPVYDWVEALFWKDERYRLLENFASASNPESPTDGAELTLFIWREFGERNDPPAINRAFARGLWIALCRVADSGRQLLPPHQPFPTQQGRCRRYELSLPSSTGA